MSVIVLQHSWGELVNISWQFAIFSLWPSILSDDIGIGRISVSNSLFIPRTETHSFAIEVLLHFSAKSQARFQNHSVGSCFTF